MILLDLLAHLAAFAFGVALGWASMRLILWWVEAFVKRFGSRR